MALKGMLAYLREEAAKAKKPTSNTLGVMHELLVGKHLLGGQHMNAHPDAKGMTPEQAHDKLYGQIMAHDPSGNMYNKLNEKARQAAEDIKKSLPPGESIKNVHWTSKPGDIKRTTGVDASQKEDSSDIYLTTYHAKTGAVNFEGHSLKVTDKKSGHVPVSNTGESKTFGKDILDDHRKAISADYHQIAKIKKEDRHDSLADARKEWMEKNPAIKEDILKRNTKTMKRVSQNMGDKLEHMRVHEPEQYTNYIRDIMAAKPTPGQKLGHRFFRHTTYGTDGNHTFERMDPASAHEHLFANPDHFTHEISGNSVIFKHKGVPVVRHRIKFESQSDPLSSIKGSGELY